MVTEALLKKIDKYIEENLAKAHKEEAEHYKHFKIDGNVCRTILSKENLPFDLKPEESWSDRLFHIIREKDFDEVDVYSDANIDRRLFSKIRSNSDYSPSKSTAISLCISMKLNINETEELLERAGYTLSRSNPSDLIVRYFIENVKNFKIGDVDKVLQDHSFKTLGYY